MLCKETNQPNKQNFISIRLIEKKIVIVHYRKVKWQSQHVAKIQRNQTNKQSDYKMAKPPLCTTET